MQISHDQAELLNLPKSFAPLLVALAATWDQWSYLLLCSVAPAACMPETAKIAPLNVGKGLGERGCNSSKRSS